MASDRKPLCGEVLLWDLSWQVPALWIGFTFWPHMAGAFRWIVSILLLAGIAVASYHVIEYPGILLGKQVAGRFRGKRSRVAALVAGD